MNSEVLRGDDSQKDYIGSYLDELRSKLPLEEFSKRTDNITFADWLETEDAQRVMDLQLFNNIVDEVAQRMERFNPDFQMLPFDRYVIGKIDPSIYQDTGGFMSKYSRGFKYLTYCGFAALLNERYTANRQLVAIELARSYLHDAFHNATFRTMRVLPEGIESKFAVYREQYGISFRKADGSSYSQNYAPSESPQKINLGVLMDGVVVMMTVEYLQPYIDKLDLEELNDFERTIIADIQLDLDLLPESYLGSKFHYNVTNPTRSFIQHWGGYELYELLIRAMLTGKMLDLIKYFDRKTGEANSWKAIFKASSY